MADDATDAASVRIIRVRPQWRTAQTMVVADDDTDVAAVVIITVRPQWVIIQKWSFVHWVAISAVRWWLMQNGRHAVGYGNVCDDTSVVFERLWLVALWITGCFDGGGGLRVFEIWDVWDGWVHPFLWEATLYITKVQWAGQTQMCEKWWEMGEEYRKRQPARKK